MLLEASLLVSIYHMTRLSLTFNTGLQMTLKYCTPLKGLDMNGWTHSNCWRLWFTCKALANSRAPSTLISLSLRLQNVREQKRKLVHIPPWMHHKLVHLQKQDLFWMEILQMVLLCPYIYSTHTNLCCSTATNQKLGSSMWTRLVVLCVYMLSRKW